MDQTRKSVILPLEFDSEWNSKHENAHSMHENTHGVPDICGKRTGSRRGNEKPEHALGSDEPLIHLPPHCWSLSKPDAGRMTAERRGIQVRHTNRHANTHTHADTCMCSLCPGETGCRAQTPTVKHAGMRTWNEEHEKLKWVRRVVVRRVHRD